MDRTGNLKKGIVSPDLLEERAKLAFDQTELRNALYLGEDEFKKIKQKYDYLNADNIRSTVGFAEFSREDQIKIQWKRNKAIWDDKTLREFFFTKNDPTEFPYKHWHADMDGSAIPTSMHMMCGPPTVKFLANEEQYKAWFQKFLNYEIVTCYAQTELGHGSNVAALETTATFD